MSFLEIRECDILTLEHKAELVAQAPFAHLLDNNYFVLPHAKGYRAFVCESHLNLETHEAYEIQVNCLYDCETLQQAIDYVLSSYDADTRHDDDANAYNDAYNARYVSRDYFNSLFA